MKAIPRTVLTGASALLFLTQPAWAVNASPTTNPIFVDGERVDLQSYTIDGYTYYKIRDLAEVLDFEVGYDDASQSIRLWNTPQNAAPAPDDPESSVTGTGSEEHSAPTSPDAPDAPIKRDVVDGKLVVLLDAGHGGSDGGTHNISETLFERDFNMAVAQKAKALLEAQGAQVLMLRGPEETERILESERIARIDRFVREYPVDLLLSIHHNATETHKATGSEILVQIAYEHGGAGQELARCIEAEYRALGRPIRPTKYQHSAENPERDRLYLLREAYERGLLAVMSEYCFLDVDSELQLVLTDEGQAREAEALTAAVMQYYTNHPY